VLRKQPTLPIIDQFKEELTELSGTFIACTYAELPRKVLSLLEENEIKEVLSWDAKHLPEGVLETLQEAGIKIEFRSHPEIRAGISGVVAAIAETGTIVITSGSGRPLSTSLLPEIHIAILRESQIRENLPQVLQLQEVQDASSVSLISGPSRTADIEMTLTIGVHGPGELFVFCIKD